MFNLLHCGDLPQILCYAIYPFCIVKPMVITRLSRLNELKYGDYNDKKNVN